MVCTKCGNEYVGGLDPGLDAMSVDPICGECHRSISEEIILLAIQYKREELPYFDTEHYRFWMGENILYYDRLENVYGNPRARR